MLLSLIFQALQDYSRLLIGTSIWLVIYSAGICAL